MGRKQSEATKQKIAASHMGMGVSKEIRDKIRSTLNPTPIVDQHGTVYASIHVAAAALGCAKSLIQRVLKGQRKTTRGFSFRFLDQPS